MTTATPPLVDVIAGVLVTHRGDFHQDDWWIICACGVNWPVDGDVCNPFQVDAVNWPVHQARAVLDALTEGK